MFRNAVMRSTACGMGGKLQCGMGAGDSGAVSSVRPHTVVLREEDACIGCRSA